VIWQLVAVPGGVEHSSVYLDGNSSNESKVWSHVAGLEVPAHGRRRAKWRVWMSPRTRESSGGTGRSPRVVWLWSQCFHASGGRFGCSGTAVLCLHGGGPLGVVVSTSRLLYQRRIISEVLILAFGRLWVEATVVSGLLCCRCK
jgi:hypothetical protein